MKENTGILEEIIQLRISNIYFAFHKIMKILIVTYYTFPVENSYRENAASKPATMLASPRARGEPGNGCYAPLTGLCAAVSALFAHRTL